MINEKLTKITDNIRYLPASMNPLSCDIVFIKTDKTTWIFDTGCCNNAAEIINSIEGHKSVVISHFHEDHITNLSRIKYDQLYVSSHTYKYSEKGNIVTEKLIFEGEPEIQIIPLPSSHAKGCLAIVCGDYCFTGDGTYCKEVTGNHTYNAQLLKDLIDVLESLSCTYICLDHDRNFVQKRAVLLRLLKQIYARKQNGNPLISVEDFFNPDGSVKV